MLVELLAVFIGGGLGALLRYLATLMSKKIFFSAICGTFIVNIIGCFLIGLLFGFAVQKAEAFSPTLKLFLTIGLLGGITTFSTLNFEVFELIKNGKIFAGILYMSGSCVIGLICTFLGYYICSKI